MNKIIEESNNLKCVISVIVPVYNVEDYLEECVYSILANSYRDYELILVDDGATDNSGKICDMFAKKDNRIKVFHKENGGLSSARNAGIDIARGEYLVFVDSDDVVRDNYLITLISYLIEYNADIVCCDLNRGDVPNWEEKECKVIVRENEDILRKLYIDDGKITLVWNKIYKKKLFDNLRFKEGTRYEDMQIMPRILNKANKMVICNDNIYFYRQRKGAITKSGNFNIERLDIISVVEDRMAFFESLQEEKLLNLEIEGYIRKLIRYRAKMDKYFWNNGEEIEKIEMKLVIALKQNFWNTKISMKIKLKALFEIVRRKNVVFLFRAI